MAVPETRIVRPRRGGVATTELLSRYELLRSLVVRNLKVKYQRSALGFLWTLLNPLGTVLILAAIFSHVVRIPVPDYWAFLLSGYFAWNFIIQTLNAGSYVLAEHASLLRSAALPPALLVLGQVFAKLLEFMLALMLILPAVAIFHHGTVPAAWLTLPLLLMLQLLLVLALTLPIVTVAAFYYDVQHALPIALTTLFYASPVFYPASMVPENARAVYLLNPIAGLLTLHQQVVYQGDFPSLGLLGATAAVSLLLFVVGYALFDRFAGVYAEII